MQQTRRHGQAVWVHTCLWAIIASCCLHHTAEAQTTPPAVGAANAASQEVGPDKYTTTGVSSLTPEAWALPDGYRICGGAKMKFMGRGVVAKRSQIEAAWRQNDAKLFLPFLITYRWTNYTAHRIQTPGLEDFESVVWEAQKWFFANKSSQQHFEDPHLSFLYSNVIESGITEITGSRVRFAYTAQSNFDTEADRLTHFVVGTQNHTLLKASALCHLILTSKTVQSKSNTHAALAPLTYDKQTAVQLAIYQAAGVYNTTVLAVNFTSATAEGSLRRRKLSDSNSNLDLGANGVPFQVWLQGTGGNFSAAAVFKTVLNSTIFKESLRPIGLRLTGGYLSSTTYLFTGNGTLLGLTHDPPRADDLVFPSPEISASTNNLAIDAAATHDSHSNVSTSVLGGIIAASIVVFLLTAVGTCWWCVLRKRRQCPLDVEEKGGTGDSTSDGTSPSRSMANIVAMYSSEFRASTSSDDTEAVSPRGGSDVFAIPVSEIQICKEADGTDTLLGRGAFGQVLKGVRRGMQPCAIKRIDAISPQNMIQIRREVSVLQHVSSHKNVVQFYGIAWVPPQSALIVMELMQGGDLRNALAGPESHEYRWKAGGRKIALAVAQGLHFLHSSGVVHRDMKASNVLLDAAGGPAKIADYGVARALSGATAASWEMAAGTFAYSAPEVLLGRKCSRTEMYSCDCYSFGVLLWSLVTGEEPVRCAMRGVDAPEECSNEVVRLLEDCITAEIAQRPSAAQIVDRLLAMPEVADLSM